MRLAKYLAMAGVASRRRAEELILQGRITVNGVAVGELGFTIEPERDEVSLDGQILYPEAKIYMLLNKPTGYICSVNDPQGRPTVMELVENIEGRVYPVGRLDLDTEGLLLMSNDGDFANLMMHPRYEMPKTYEALVKGQVGVDALYSLGNGVVLEDGITAPAQVRIIASNKDKTLLELEIHEGRKRQVRRMCATVGHPVISLKRIAFAGLTLQGVAQGKVRYLTPQEVKRLVELARRIQE